MKRWPLNKAAFWESAPFFRLLVPLAAGIIAYYSFGIGSVSYAPIAALVLFAVYLTVALRKVQNNVTSALTFILAQLFLLTASLALVYLYDVKNSKSWYGNCANNSGVYMASLAEEPHEGLNTWKLHVHVLKHITASTAEPTTGEAFVYIYKDELPILLHTGDPVLLPHSWQPIRNAGNPFEFDYAGYCQRNNIYYQQVCSARDVRLYGTQNDRALSAADKMHNWCMAQLNRHITDIHTRGLIQAMLLGDETNLDNELRQSFTDMGIVHIVAISGGNITMFFFLVSGLLWWMRDKRFLWVKYAIALPLVWFYVVMAGASPSAVRAGIMFTILSAGIGLQKNRNDLNQLFATAFVLLCAEPAWLYALGFQLSFVAVLSLILFYPAIHKWYTPPRIWLLRTLWATAAASIAAEILVAPLVIYYFHTFPLLFLVANVLGYIFMTAVLVLGIAIIVLSWLPVAATALGTATIWLVHFFDRILNWLQQFNPDSLQKLTLSAIELALLYTTVAGVSYYLFKRRKQALLIGSAAVLLLAILLSIDEWQWHHQRRMVIYNAGREIRIELVSGKAHHLVCGDTALTHKIDYITKSAHIGWHTETATQLSDSSFTIGGKSVTLLGNKVTAIKPNHADYVVMTGAAQDVALIKEIYSPRVIVISGKGEHQDFCKECQQNGIATYEVGNSGAYIIE